MSIDDQWGGKSEIPTPRSRRYFHIEQWLITESCVHPDMYILIHGLSNMEHGLLRITTHSLCHLLSYPDGCIQVPCL